MREVVHAEILTYGLTQELYIEVILFEKRTIKYEAQGDRYVIKDKKTKTLNLWEFNLSEGLKMFSPKEQRTISAFCKGQLYRLGVDNTPPVYVALLGKMEMLINSRGPSINPVISPEEEKKLEDIFKGFDLRL